MIKCYMSKNSKLFKKRIKNYHSLDSSIHRHKLITCSINKNKKCLKLKQNRKIANSNKVNSYPLLSVSLYIYHKNNAPSRLFPQCLCGNSCTWAHDVRLYIYTCVYVYVCICVCYCWYRFIYISLRGHAIISISVSFN